MKRKTLFSFLAIAALGLLTAAPANADFGTRTWKSTSSTDFSVATNWNPENVPDTVHEEAIIPDLSGSLVVPVMTQAETVGGVEIQARGTLNTGAYTLTIQASDSHGDGVLTIAHGGVLDIQAGGKVILASAVKHVIDGELKLSTGTSTLAITDSTTVNGRGAIVGQDNAAELWIAVNKTLINNITARGKMKVMTDPLGGVGNGVFDNRHVVLANANGTLLMDSSLTLADTAGASWEAKSDSSAVLKFDEDATNLIGKFVLCKDATFQFADGVDISTTGCFIVAAANGFLDFLGTPGSFHTDDITCSSGGAGNWSADHEFTGTCND